MFELALKLIADNKRSKAKILDLGRCGLTTLPEELAELVWLETLNLGDVWHDWGPNGNKTTIPPNKGTSNAAIQDISLLAQLPLLQVVALNGTKVANLAPLVGLKKLRNLNALGCPLQHLQALAGISTLQLLMCTSTLIKNLSPLSGLNALQTLFLNSTQAA